MFGASAFLVGLAAVAVPLAIHLWARQRMQKLPWGAMPFLHESMASASSKRNRLKDLILLLLRMLAIVCLVLTFAQPLWSKFALGRADLETIFIWDVSLSTMTLDEEGEPFHESLRATLLEEIEALPDRSRVKILLAGAEVRWLREEALELSDTNRESLRAAIRNQPVDRGGSALASAILTAFSKSESGSAKSRLIVVLHDARRNAWQDEEEVLWKTIRERLAGDSRLALRVLPFAKNFKSEARQLSVNDLTFEREILAMNTPGRFRVTLKNHSDSVVRNARLIWRVDGRILASESDFSIPPEEELKMEQVLQFDTSGSRRVECELEYKNDLMPADNLASLVVEVPDGLPILIVDDTVRSQRGQILPSEFLAASLGQLSRERGKKSRLFDSQVVGSDSLDTAMLERCLAVVIAKADSLPDQFVGDLRDYVEGGGGLWIMMDSTAENMPRWMSILLGELGLGGLSKTERLAAKESDKPMKIIASDPEGGFAQGMAADRLDLFRAELQAVHDLKERIYLEQEQLLETELGTPVLLSLGVGAGKVMLQTTDLSRANTNLPLLQSFVPLVREVILESIKGALPRRNLEAGEPIRVPLLSVENSSSSGIVAHPDGSKSQLVPRGNWYEMGDTLQPGIYEELASGAEPVGLFSVRRPASESDLEAISAEEIARLVSSSNQIAPTGKISEEAWPLAWYFAMAAGFFFVAEALLANFMARSLAEPEVGIELKPSY